MVKILKKKLEEPYEGAVERVKDLVSTEFSILMTKPLDEVIRKKLDLPDYPLKYTTILACGPELAKMALDVSVDVGTLMPCSFTVYEEDDEVFVSHISIMKIASELELADSEEMRSVIKKTGDKVGKVWREI